MLFVLALLLGASIAPRTTDAQSISAKEAYERVRTTGELVGQGVNLLVVEDVFYADRAASGVEGGTILFRNVHFAGGIRVSKGADVSVSVHFENVRSPFFQSKEVQWLGGVELDRCEIGRLRFERGRFHETVTITDSRFDAAYFKAVVVDGPLNIHSEIRESSFSGSQFNAPAAFDDTVFDETAKFYGTTFEKDVSFANVQANVAILFQRVTFKGEAEFTRCQFVDADFGRDWLTVFEGLAEFRECAFGGARFDAAEFLGRATFAGAQFGSAGVSFADTHFASNSSTLEGVSITGPLTLSTASATLLRYHWDEVEEAVLRADPHPDVLEAMILRLNELGRGADARKVRYWIRHRARLERLRASGVTRTERAFIQLKYVMWGLPTKYGTSPLLFVSTVVTGFGVLFFFVRARAQRRSVDSRPSIFISYRRALDAADALLIHQELERQQIDTFIDVDDVGLGPFPARLSDAASRANVMLVVISPDWATLTDSAGNRRLADPGDWVRREIGVGLESRSLLVPALVKGASMPGSTDLPPDIKALADYQGVSLRSDAWKRDFAHLVELLADGES